MNLLVIFKSPEHPDGHVDILSGEAYIGPEDNNSEGDWIRFVVDPQANALTFAKPVSDIVQAFESVVVWTKPIETEMKDCQTIYARSRYWRLWREISVEELRERLAAPPCPYRESKETNE